MCGNEWGSKVCTARYVINAIRVSGDIADTDASPHTAHASTAPTSTPPPPQPHPDHTRAARDHRRRCTQRLHDTLRNDCRYPAHWPLDKLTRRYHCMADEYYTSNTDAPRNESMGRLQYMRSLGHRPEVRIPTWEWFAGSGRFSAAARSRGIPHLPPQDLRWGNNLGFWVHQVTALWVLLVYPVDVLFGSPNCTPWSNNARQWPEEER